MAALLSPPPSRQCPVYVGGSRVSGCSVEHIHTWVLVITKGANHLKNLGGEVGVVRASRNCTSDDCVTARLTVPVFEPLASAPLKLPRLRIDRCPLLRLRKLKTQARPAKERKEWPHRPMSWAKFISWADNFDVGDTTGMMVSPAL